MERQGIITFQGNPLTLVGNELKVGDKAPEFTLAGNDLSPVTLGDSDGSVRIVSVVPSLDTPVCDIQTRRFNKEADALDGVKVLTVSMDLPFAQARWCGAAEAENVLTLSDYRDANFGKAWGLLIKELHLLARAVAVLDASGTVTHLEVVPEVTDEPDYDAALAAAKALV